MLLFIAEGQGSTSTSNLSAPVLSQNPDTTITANDPFNEANVKAIEVLGFSRVEVIAELRRFNGDAMQATAALCAKSLKF